MPSRSQYALSGMRTGTETCPYDHTNLRFRIGTLNQNLNSTNANDCLFWMQNE